MVSGGGLTSGNLDGFGCLDSFSSRTHSHSSPLLCISQNQPAPGLFGESMGETGLGPLEEHPICTKRMTQLISRNMGHIL